MSMLSPLAILRQLRLGKESSTFERLGRSRHVADLRLIFSVTVILMMVGVIAALAACYEYQVVNYWQGPDEAHDVWSWVTLGFAAIVASGPFIGAICILGGGVLAWTYQTGSARLGVVDLFACEIATLCRVGAVVDMVQRYVTLFEKGPQVGQPQVIDGESPSDTSHFNSQESYFPVFDSSVKDLQALEADVVKHVTAFYTYMKVMRDTLRKLADIKPPAAGGRPDDDWHRAICSVIYMQFLALESARKAIKDLVEFEPTQAEDMITVPAERTYRLRIPARAVQGRSAPAPAGGTRRIIPARHSGAASPRHGGARTAMGGREGSFNGDDEALRSRARGHADTARPQGGVCPFRRRFRATHVRVYPDAVQAGRPR